ncbi:MAG: PLP-dependent aminotransferase family protein [Polyangia bacterium]|jgi:2-aminoadipate transaminase|nr:PLP-dependent aminotransferase family protein [Polyangia bacterium]
MSDEPRSPYPSSADPPDPFLHLYTERARQQQASSIREICKLGARPEVRSLAGGWPAPGTFPVEEVAEIARDVLASRGPDALQYCQTEGVTALRDAMARWASDKLGIPATRDHILITHGSQQGMDLIFRVLVEPGDVVLCGLPTYFGATGAVSALGGRLVGIPVDQDGLDAEAAAVRLEELRAEGARPKGIYIIPSFQNPAGVALSLARRQRLLALAKEHDLLIIEDDPYGELRFDGQPIPCCKALERAAGAEGRVVHIHSLSKTFAPGLRLAWVAADPGVVRRMVVAKQYVDTCTNTFGQYLLLEFVSRGLLERQIEANIAYYRGQRDALLSSLDRHFPSDRVRWNRPEGGLFVLVHLPEGMDADALSREALAHNVAFVSGAQFHHDGSGKNTFRLSFSQSSPEVMEEAVARIGALIRAKLGA